MRRWRRRHDEPDAGIDVAERLGPYDMLARAEALRALAAASEPGAPEAPAPAEPRGLVPPPDERAAS